MRQVFASTRLETSEGVVALLAAEGIETLVRNGRSYKGGYGRRGSYADSAAPAATVWVVRADDFSRARDILRQAGLLGEGDDTRGRFMASPYAAAARQAQAGRKGFTPNRLRMGLLFAIAAVLVMLALWQHRRGTQQAPATAASRTLPAAPAQTGSAGLPPLRVQEAVYTAAVPTALAEHVFARTRAAHGLENPCLQRDDTLLRVAPDCDSRQQVHVHSYRTDGSGTGEVQVAWKTAQAAGSQRLEVRREGHVWHTLRVLE